MLFPFLVPPRFFPPFPFPLDDSSFPFFFSSWHMRLLIRKRVLFVVFPYFFCLRGYSTDHPPNPFSGFKRVLSVGERRTLLVFTGPIVTLEQVALWVFLVFPCQPHSHYKTHCFFSIPGGSFFPA